MQSLLGRSSFASRQPCASCARGAAGSSLHLVVLMALALALASLPGCGQRSGRELLADYRAELEGILAVEAPTLPRSLVISEVRLPDRRDRRLPVGDQRVGPFDFLATMGCRLSEIVAERNGVLGKVLEPTRRLAHEVSVAEAIEECLPTLSAERAARLRLRLEEKRADLAAHVWNAVWLDEDLERYLSGGPRSLFGGGDANDGAWQLQRAAEAIDELDIEGLELAFSQLADDAAVGPLLRDWAGSVAELERIAALLSDSEPSRCERDDRRLARVFRERYLPMQSILTSVDRRGRDVTRGLSSLYGATARATADRAEVPSEMGRFALALFGSEAAPGLVERSRAAHLAHAAAWAPRLEACGLIPSGNAASDGSAGDGEAEHQTVGATRGRLATRSAADA
jgi:hypothetical protein